MKILFLTATHDVISSETKPMLLKEMILSNLITKMSRFSIKIQSPHYKITNSQIEYFSVNEITYVNMIGILLKWGNV